MPGEYTAPLVSNFGCGYASYIHTYPFADTFHVKHILYNGTQAIDSIEHDYVYRFCRLFKTSFYFDDNNNCIYDNDVDKQLIYPVLSTVDSNGVTIDTVSTTSGFYYEAKGNAGDIYTFHVIDAPGDLQTNCPVSGSVYHTLQSLYDNYEDQIGFTCGNSGAFDLRVIPSLRTAANRSDIGIIIGNEYCNEQDAVLTMHFSPKYEYTAAIPTPTSQNGTTIAWDLNSVSGTISTPVYLQVHLYANNNQLLTVGDTVHTSFSVGPTVGDIDPLNNVVIRHDTVRGPYDPNAVLVSPPGCVLPGTKLEYTVTFENLGNDTARFIRIMDTLSDGVDIQSMRILGASHLMNVTKVSNGGYNILKFEFPNINLPDSSSPARHGMVMYTIDMFDNFPIGSAVTNKAGIFFDYMPAVLTNVASTTACWPASVSETASSFNSIRIYPNPATEELTIKTEQAYSSCTITNSIGQVMMEQNINSKDAKVNIRSLSTGIYYLSLKGQGGTVVRKFVKL